VAQRAEQSERVRPWLSQLSGQLLPLARRDEIGAAPQAQPQNQEKK
jgi:hypothetical protein